MSTTLDAVHPQIMRFIRKYRLLTYQPIDARQILQCVAEIKIGSSAHALFDRAPSSLQIVPIGGGDQLRGDDFDRINKRGKLDWSGRW
ncbi:hypothetical protein [Bradyrhizobium sp. sGM-13]|uniref:hypothetical protein n=1 Tax=Bradyrhizobium sp. sGM-13 TaxID=2831781 RepID=UPI001BCC2E91|nr:hypothetical protein [Bradyrhizobium sp. sGM-13]